MKMFRCPKLQVCLRASPALTTSPFSFFLPLENEVIVCVHDILTDESLDVSVSRKLTGRVDCFETADEERALS